MIVPLFVLCALLAGCAQKTGAKPRADDGSPSVLASKQPDTKDMVLVEGGTFEMGADDNMPNERPVHKATVKSFYIDPYEVTNAQFAKFVKETGYVTEAEKIGDSIVFTGTKGKVPLDNPARWWDIIKGADWRHPHGADSSIDGLENHPVVQVSWNDAMAYAKWAGKTLPTEAQWEYAAKKGLVGDPKHPKANIFEGEFPYHNTGKDGYITTAPVGSFPPDSLGLYDMAGNVWEWCLDWYRPDYYEHSPQDDPPGPASGDPVLPQKTIRGGSFLCNAVYCRGYEPSTRMMSPPDDAHDHTGFRCVVNP